MSRAESYALDEHEYGEYLALRAAVLRYGRALAEHERWMHEPWGTPTREDYDHADALRRERESARRNLDARALALAAEAGPG